jgi:hypothetical protein
MLLVLLPVFVLVAFTLVAAAASRRHANDLRHFQTASRLSGSTAGLAQALAEERLLAVAQNLRPGAPASHNCASAQDGVNRALGQASTRAAGWKGTAEVAGTLDAARRQVHGLRLEAASRSIPIEDVEDSYSLIVNNLLGVVGNLDSARPTHASGRAADAYVVLVQANEAAERERIDEAQLLAAPGPGGPPTTDPSASLQDKATRHLPPVRQHEARDELDALLLQPASVRVKEVRHDLTTDPNTAKEATSVEQWLTGSTGRLADLRRREGDTSQFGCPSRCVAARGERRGGAVAR